MKKKFPVVMFGFVLSLLFAGFLLARSLMEMFEETESLWDSEMDLED